MRITRQAFLIMLLTVSMVSCTKYLTAPEVPAIITEWFGEQANRQLCGVLIEWWGDSLTDAPGYPGIYCDWYMADALKYDKLIVRTEMLGGVMTTRNLLEKNMTHNYGFPGRTANELWDLWKTQANPTSAQFLWPGRNSVRDTASITRFYDSVLVRLKSVNNTKFFVVGLINSNTESERPGSEMHNLVTAYNYTLLMRFKSRYIDPIAFFIPYSDATDIRNHVIPMKYTIGDGLHPNQEGAKIIGLGTAKMIEPCASYTPALRIN